MSSGRSKGMAVDRLIAFFQSRGLALLLFHLGTLLFSWPLLSLCAEDGGPSLFSYIFLVWGVLVCLLVIMGRCLGRDKDRGA
ncbi:hypothetical protein [Pseudodesulfovibrio sp. zrk46]|uniref:hypothetical protein n=1 Tax=Pseudodesulfovibrio sp. zrk46 TaxID=2725288 RepID=UPI00144A14BC|nr:hypothetical protein [Pseudodesulfovibrio sp. zrk46]QJB56344.1 hypothetical protein HFN16_07925 [Pseudodesulfovibrio sp. zrk46]